MIYLPLQANKQREMDYQEFMIETNLRGLDGGIYMPKLGFKEEKQILEKLLRVGCSFDKIQKVF